MGIAQGILASNLAGNLNGVLQEFVKGGATIYDKAMDLPFVTWDKATLDDVTSVLESNLGVPKEWFFDLNTYDNPEFLGSTVGAVALVLNGNGDDAEAFARMAGGLGVSGAVGANPALFVVTVVALAWAYHRAQESGDYTALLDGQLMGAVGSGSTLRGVSTRRYGEAPMSWASSRITPRSANSSGQSSPSNPRNGSRPPLSGRSCRLHCRSAQPGCITIAAHSGGLIGRLG